MPGIDHLFVAREDYLKLEAQLDSSRTERDRLTQQRDQFLEERKAATEDYMAVRTELAALRVERDQSRETAKRLNRENGALLHFLKHDEGAQCWRRYFKDYETGWAQTINELKAMRVERDQALQNQERHPMCPECDRPMVIVDQDCKQHVCEFCELMDENEKIGVERDRVWNEAIACAVKICDYQEVPAHTNGKEDDLIIDALTEAAEKIRSLARPIPAEKPDREKSGYLTTP